VREEAFPRDLREKRPAFFYPPFEQSFGFGYDNVANLFHDPRLSADRMLGFVAAAPEEVRENSRKVRKLKR
jgi:hypothetical protein